MRVLASRPAVLLVAAWAAGIFGGEHAAVSARAWAGLAVALWVLALGLWLGRARLALLLGAALLALAAAGAARTRVVATPPSTDVSRWIGRQVGITGTVAQEPSTGARRQRFLLEAESAQSAGQPRPATGRVHVSAPLDGAPVALGERVTVFGVPERPLPATNPGGLSAADWLRGQGCFTTLHLRPASLVPRGRGRLPWWREGPVRLRRWLTSANREALDRTMARRGVPAARRADLVALVHAVALGSPDAPDADWGSLRQRFRDTGIVHLLVVSGAQVALVIWLLMLLRPRLGVLASAALALGAIWLYAALTGAEPSILRAAIMGSCWLVGLIVLREAMEENSLAIAAFLLLLWNPLSLDDMGFQLSFAAMWGLIRLGAPLEGTLRPLLPGWGSSKRPPHPIVAGLRRYQCDPLSLSVGSVTAQLFTAGIIAQTYQRLHVVGLVANLIAVPLTSLLLVLSLPVAFLNAVWGAVGLPLPPAWPLNWINELIVGLASFLDRSAVFFAARGWAWWFVFPPGWAAIVLSLAGLLLMGTWLRPARSARSATTGESDLELPAASGLPARWRAALTAGALGLLALAAGMFWPARPPGGVELTFIDVGQGDCLFARFPDGGTLLVDGGGSPFSDVDVGEQVVAPTLRALRICRIDLMVLSHAHEDHVGGLPAVLREFRVGRVLDAAGPVDAKSYPTFRELIRARRIPFTVARQGMRVTVGPRRAAVLEVLHPPERLLAGTGSDVNNNSIVLRLSAAGTRFLLTGDAEAAAEATMRDLDVQAALLKVGHHGSRTSTSDAWLDAVRPRLAVISCGRHNSFGHPGRATLAHLRRHAVACFRTDRDGAVTVLVRDGRIEARGTLSGTPVDRPEPRG